MYFNRAVIRWMLWFSLAQAFSLSAATFTVLTNLDSGPGTLRQAIADANATPGLDTIQFNIPGTGQHVIRPLSPLPDISGPVVVDGYTQPGSAPNDKVAGFKAVLRIVIQGDLAGTGADGLRFLAASNIVRGLSIFQFQGDQIKLISGGGNVIEGNMIGDTFGATPSTAVGNGIHIVAPNFDVRSLSEFNTIGGETPAAKNLISGNSNGVRIVNSTGNRILGNLIGIRFGDSLPQPNFANGIEVLDTSANHYIEPTNYIGGLTIGARNVISGNGVSTLTTNGHGIRVVDSAVLFAQGNFIGTDPMGEAAIPNLGDGIAFYQSYASYHRVGGNSPEAGNLISGNGRNGIGLYSTYAFTDKSAAILIQGNTIGLNAEEIRPVPNSENGIELVNSIAVILGNQPGAGNTISGNRGHGILLTNSSSNVIRGNRIGTDASGLIDLGNGLNGVLLSDSFNNFVGGTIEGQGNTIAFNHGTGVAVMGTSAGDAIEGNPIFSNGALGIDLGTSGITTNDPGDVDTGPNRLQNYPVINSVSTNGSMLVIAGQVTSSRLQGARLEFFGNDSCDASGHGEGQVYLGSVIAYMDSGGNADFTANLPLPAHRPVWITATATDSTGNTSEFSPCAAIGSDVTPYDLSITRGTNSTAIAWPASASAFVLERTASLSPPVSWETVTNGIMTEGANRTFSVTNSPGPTNVFFRLRKQ